MSLLNKPSQKERNSAVFKSWTLLVSAPLEIIPVMALDVDIHVWNIRCRAKPNLYHSVGSGRIISDVLILYYCFRLQHEIEDVRSHSDAQLVKVSRDMANKDFTVTTLRETQDILKAELAQRKEDAQRYMYGL